MDLHSPLSAIESSPSDDLWTEDLLRWVLEVRPTPNSAHCPRHRRLRLLIQDLENHPRAAEARTRLRGVLAHASASRLLAEAGLPDHPGLFKEVAGRWMDRLLPWKDMEGDLYALVQRLELRQEDIHWAMGLPTLDGLADLLPDLRGAARDAAELLAIRTAALGMSRTLLRLSPAIRDMESPFAALPRLAQRRAPGHSAAEVLHACRIQVKQWFSLLETQGVSMNTVFELETLEAQLRRLELLLAFLDGRASTRELLAEVLQGAVEQRQVLPVFKHGAHRLARKILEHTGRTGEDYLVKAPGEYSHMFLAAGGGGALTAFTALFKILITALPFAPGPLGLCFAFNYSASFVAMQFLHFPLASKQPALTASALASGLGQQDGLRFEIELVASIARGQAAATFGNLLFALPTALAVDALWRLLSGHTLAHAEKATHLLQDLDPLHSWTLPYAALTGVFLWLASLSTGWIANWSAYRNLAEGAARSPLLRNALGRSGAERFGRWLEAHLPGIVGYLVLGFLLGFLPNLSTFLGLHLEVRHVTLSTATLGFSLSHFLWSGGIPWALVLSGLVGIGCIGLLNFSVSFALSMGLAVLAKNLSLQTQRELILAILKHAFRHPFRFLFPIQSKE